MQILFVEDDEQVVAALAYRMKKFYGIDNVTTKREAISKIHKCTYDLIVLDRYLPDGDGVDLCLEMRESELTTPILMITGNGCNGDVVDMLENGIDDYLEKPFRYKEFLARIRALIRRSHQLVSSVVLCRDLRFDTGALCVERAGLTLKLRKKEMLILEFLMRHKNQIVSREKLFEYVWGPEKDTYTNTVDVHIKNLRDKVDKGFDSPLIKTVHGLGYMIED